jgi:iron complex outermembrane receptor protein
MTYRNRTRCKALRAALMASGALMTQLAHAQSTASASSGATLEEIVVTAQKRVQSISDVGMTITALSGYTLERQGIKSLSDLASQVPGLTYAPTDFGTPVFTLRGVGFYDYSIGGYPTTSVYVDEIPLPFPAYTTHANLDVERVEVLKGPQGTLFGQNSTGGAINNIAAKPSSTFEAGINVSDARFSQGDVDGYISGPITENLKARLAFEHDFGGDWQHSYTRNESLGAKDVTNARLLLYWQPTDDLKFLLNLNGWQDKSDPQASQFIALVPQLSLGPNKSAVNPKVAAYPFAPSDPTAADWSPDHRPQADKRQYQTALRGDYNITDNIVLTSITSYVNYNTNQTLDMDGTSTDLFQYNDVSSANSFTQELRVAGGEGTPFRWVGGGNYEHSHTNEATFQTFSDSTIGTVLGGGDSKGYVDQKFENYAIFANGEYDLLPNLTAKLGGRYTHSRDTGNECTYDAGDRTTTAIYANLYSHLHPGVPFPATKPGDCLNFLQSGQPGLFVDTLAESNVSWRGGLDYKVTRDVLLYVNVARGYKAGSFPSLPAISYRSYLPVTQEGLLDYEVGFKTKFFDHKLGVNGAAFYYDYTNKQLLTKILDPLVHTTQALANIPKSQVKGAELEVTAVPIEGLHLSSGLTYLDAIITNYVGINAAGVSTDFAGSPIPFTPKWQYVLSADYDIPTTSSKIQPFIGVTLTGRTGTTSIVGSAIGTSILPGYHSAVPLANIYSIPSYNVLDLRAGLEAPDGTWRAMVWAKNVTNTYYWNNVIPAYEAVTRYAGQPQTYGVTFNYKF